MSLPYRIAALCYLFDAQGRVLLLERRRSPNRGLCSPVGGKLHQEEGESPAACAAREIEEETAVSLGPGDLHLTGIVSERGYRGENHWLMFLFEVRGPVTLAAGDTEEGHLDWHPPETIPELAIPDTDRHVIWPLFWRYRGRFFAAHIDCENGGLTWRLEQPAEDATAS